MRTGADECEERGVGVAGDSAGAVDTVEGVRDSRIDGALAWA